MTEEQAAQICDALARIAVSLENIGKAVEEQRRPAPAAAASRSATATSSRPAPRPARRPQVQ